MNKGLGKNTPVQLKLSESNYDALIGRHGQHVRWMRADKCPCVLANGRPDLSCQYCSGDGWRYSFQTAVQEFGKTATVVNTGICEFPEKIAKAISIKDYLENEFTVSAILGDKHVKFAGSRVPDLNEELTVSYERSLIKSEHQAACSYAGNSVLTVNSLKKSSAYGDVLFDLLSAASVYNKTKDETYTVSSLHQNRITFTYSVEPEVGDDIKANVTYIEPFVFAVLNQSKRIADQRFMDEVQGDSWMTFPDGYKVNEGDVVTLLIGTNTRKRIITKSATGYDKIPEFFVTDIKKVEIESQVYAKDTDYTLWGKNQIKWLGATKPAGGDNYSVFFEYYPTYRVLKELPNTRSSENVRFPRRVVLKLLAGISKNEEF